MKKRLLATLLISALVLALLPATALAQTVEVATLPELEAALAGSADTIVVTAEITLPNGTNLNGGGKTIRVPTPYMNEDGTAHGAGVSAHRVFSIASGSAVTLTNMTVMGGGYATGSNSILAAINNFGTLTMTNVTVTRSNRGIENQNTGKLILKNCCITRNAAYAGGGILNYTSAIAVLDGCSLSENRSLAQIGGGGAAQNNGKMYINNTVIANNSSTELGGAINNKGNLYLMNTTVSGNISIHGSYGARTGGGIGNNNGTVKAANCIFADNYAKKTTANGGTMTLSDIGLYSGNNLSLQYCMLGIVVSYGDTPHGINEYPTCAETTDAVFAGYRSDGIPFKESEYTAGFRHAVLVNMTNNADARYAPLRNNSPAATGGVFTSYIDYSNINDVRMSYQVTDGGTMTELTGTVTDTTKQVTGYFEATPRESYVMGASGAESGTPTYFTVTLGSYEHGAVQGASIYGNSYPAGTSVTVTAIPDVGASFGGWKINDEPTPSVYDSTYIFPLERDIKLTPVFTLNSYTISFDMNGGTGAIAPKAVAYGENMPAITNAERPTRAHYDLSGFYDAATGGTQYYYSGGTSARTWDKEADTTLYAQWSGEKYLIEYLDSGGTSYSGNNRQNLPNDHTYGTDTTLPAPTKAGFTGAWYTDVNCTGTPITTLLATGYTAAITLYAKWTVPISISPRNTFVQGSAPGNLTVNVGQTGSDPSDGDFSSLEIGPGGTNFETVDSSNYSVTYGSIHIALAQDWLNTLAPGEYTLKVNLAYTMRAVDTPTTQLIVTAPGAGDAEADIPQAGDGSTPLLWAGLMLLAGMGLGVRRRRRGA